MSQNFQLPERFEEQLGIPVRNARERLVEARELGDKLARGGVPMKHNPDHFAMFTDPPRLLAGPLKRLGYVLGADNRCYPSPVDGCDYINVAASLPAASALRQEGWPDHIAVVHPVDDDAHERMAAQNYGNPFIHHITFGIPTPADLDAAGLALAERLVRRMAETRGRIASLLVQQPGTLILALPPEIVRTPEFADRFPAWIDGLPADQYQLEEMEGGGFLLQFFVLCGGRIEVALRHGTRQTFNPKSVHKISEDELSVDQGPVAAIM
ncbi:MAG: hypothetical protein ACK5AZ_13405 [Bryobacteraceae bacterium]